MINIYNWIVYFPQIQLFLSSVSTAYFVGCGHFYHAPTVNPGI